MSAGAWVLVGLVGGGAAAARFLIDASLAERSDHPFPLGILAINIGGTLALVDQSDAPADIQPGPSLFTAVEQQLGLKLLPFKGTRQVIVIDHIEKPSAN